MKLGFTTLLAAAIAAVLLVPAAGAKPGNGNGNGHGPPAWAGGGNGAAKARGKPDPAEKQARKAEKAERKSERRAARAAVPNGGEDSPKHENPAWICKFEREQMGEEAFAEEYGTNENKANAFGKCVSQEAHERDGVEADEEEATPPGDEESSDPAEPTDGESSETVKTLASVRAFFHYLWPFL